MLLSSHVSLYGGSACFGIGLSSAPSRKEDVWNRSVVEIRLRQPCVTRYREDTEFKRTRCQKTSSRLRPNNGITPHFIQVRVDWTTTRRQVTITTAGMVAITNTPFAYSFTFPPMPPMSVPRTSNKSTDPAIRYNQTRAIPQRRFRSSSLTPLSNH